MFVPPRPVLRMCFDIRSDLRAYDLSQSMLHRKLHKLPCRSCEPSAWWCRNVAQLFAVLDVEKTGFLSNEQFEVGDQHGNPRDRNTGTDILRSQVCITVRAPIDLRPKCRLAMH